MSDKKLPLNWDTFLHPKTGHYARAYVEDWGEPKPTSITIEVKNSKYPGEEHYIMAEMSGIIMLPDGTAKLWVSVSDGLTIPKAVVNAGAQLMALWDECMHGDDPGVKHCYCTEANIGPFESDDVTDGYTCCRCSAGAPLSYFPAEVTSKLEETLSDIPEAADSLESEEPEERIHAQEQLAVESGWVELTPSRREDN